ncbi:MAG TPA: DUF4339 domain-containing protein [Verrucomicrobiae bacterium]|jgi:hypothetical protein
MDWHYSEGTQKKGPVSDAELDRLLQSGGINDDTLIWRAGMTDWQPLKIARAGTGGASPGNACVECGKLFPPDEMVKLNNSWVCAQCKPIFLQRLAEGTTVPSAGTLWRTNKKVVAKTGTIFPDRCIKCNAPANGFRLKRVLYWQHPAYLLLLLCNLLVLLVVILIVRKKAVVEIGLCGAHRARRKRGIIIGLSGLFGGIILIIGGIVFHSGIMVVAGLISLIGISIYGLILARTLSPTKIDKEYVWASGCSREFLEALPEWHGK